MVSSFPYRWRWPHGWRRWSTDSSVRPLPKLLFWSWNWEILWVGISCFQGQGVFRAPHQNCSSTWIFFQIIFFPIMCFRLLLHMQTKLKVLKNTAQLPSLMVLCCTLANRLGGFSDFHIHFLSPLTCMERYLISMWTDCAESKTFASLNWITVWRFFHSFICNNLK